MFVKKNLNFRLLLLSYPTQPVCGWGDDQREAGRLDHLQEDIHAAREGHSHHHQASVQR